MENILDYNIDEKRNENVIIYATFLSRVAASFIDGLLVLIVLPLSIYNLLEWKSILVLIFTTAITFSYKPFMEYKYGATLGKMAVKIRVVNYDFQHPSLQEVLLRNIVHIINISINFLLTLYFLTLPEFINISTYTEYQIFIASKSTLLNMVIGLVTLGDILFMFSDKQNRTLHDRIGKTLVVTRYNGQ